MHRKLILLISFILLIVAVVTIPVCADGGGAVLAEAWDVETLRAWLEAEVLPHLAAVVTILGVALVELIPAIRGLCKAKGVFSKVAADVDAYNKAKIEYDMRVEKREQEFEERMERLQGKYNEMVAELSDTVKTYEQKLSESEERLAHLVHNVEVSASKTERMVYIGMSNSRELVCNGSARRIAEVEDEKEEEDEAEESEAEEGQA